MRGQLAEPADAARRLVAEAAGGAEMAGRPVRVGEDEQGVAVAIGEDRPDREMIAAGLALLPQPPLRPAEEGGEAARRASRRARRGSCSRASARWPVSRVLDDGGQQAVHLVPVERVEVAGVSGAFRSRMARDTP